MDNFTNNTDNNSNTSDDSNTTGAGINSNNSITNTNCNTIDLNSSKVNNNTANFSDNNNIYDNSNGNTNFSNNNSSTAISENVAYSGNTSSSGNISYQGNTPYNYWTSDQIKSIQLNMSYVDLKNLSNWATFRAVMDIITGALSCLGIITAAYGVPQIISGIKLLNTVTLLNQYMATNDTINIAECFYRLNEYFKLNGISTIVKVALSVFMLIIWFAIIYFISQLGYNPIEYGNYKYNF